MSSKKNTKPTWKCPKDKGCDISVRACKHMNLPRPDAGMMSLETRKKLSDLLKIVKHDEKMYNHLEKQLIETGFEKFEVDLVMDRFISNLTVNQMCKKYNVKSVAAMTRLLDSLSTRITRLLVGDFN